MRKQSCFKIMEEILWEIATFHQKYFALLLHLKNIIYSHFLACFALFYISSSLIFLFVYKWLCGKYEECESCNGCHYSPEWLVVCVHVLFGILHKEIRNKYLTKILYLLVPVFSDQVKEGINTWNWKILHLFNLKTETVRFCCFVTWKSFSFAYTYQSKHFP